MRVFAIVLTLAIVGGGLKGAHPAARQSVAPAALPTPFPHRALVDRYCVTCHHDRLRTAGLSLAQARRPSASAEVWEKVIRKLRSGAMPPTGMPRPDPAMLDGFVTYLETSIDRDAAARPNPGRPAPPRLNRTEYSNAIRDLLAV